MELKAVDIVGCSSGVGTRPCTSHEVCGDALAINDYVMYRLEVVRSYTTMLNNSDSEDEGMGRVL